MIEPYKKGFKKRPLKTQKHRSHSRLNPKKKPTGFLKTAIIFLILTVFIISTLTLILSTKENEAILYIETGTALIQRGNDWVQAVNGQKLKEGDKIKTLPTGYATIVFYDSSVARLENSTEITIKNLEDGKIHLLQEYGNTWNSVKKIAGIESFDVETPTNIASVTGTEFIVEETNLLVSEGNVEYTVGIKKKDNYSVNVEKGYKILTKTESYEFNLTKLTQEDINRFNSHKKASIESLKQQRLLLIKQDYILNRLSKEYNEEDLKLFLDRVDKELIDKEKVKENLPIKTKTVEKIDQITEIIQKLEKDLQ